MKPFDMSTITCPENLFGREDLLKRLSALARRNDNVQIIGSRRFGKTCVLRCMHTILRKEDSVYPIYVDMKADGIRKTCNVYMYLSSILIEQLYKDKIYTHQEKIASIEILPCDDWTSIYEQLQNSAISLVKAQKIFSELVNTFAELMEKNILFLFDEYEFMFKYGFDSPEGFMKLRTLSTSTLGNGIHPFSFWIAGSKTWDVFCTLIGSGELNVINTTEYILPITYEDFSSMWDHECALIEDETIKNLVSSHKKRAFEASGGVPFYAKLIAANTINTEAFPTYRILSTYFSEIESGLHPSEMQVLDVLFKTPKAFPQSSIIKNLEDHGLILLNLKTGQYSVPIVFFVEYLKARQQDKTLMISKDTIIRQYVDKITKLVENINSTYHNKKDEYLFGLVNDNDSLINDLRTVCSDKDQFKDFCSALYKYYLERTKKDGKNREKLPKEFRYSRFANIVDMFRHTFGGGHEIDMLELQNWQKSKSDMLFELTGSRNEPNSAEEFSKLQQTILTMFIKELESINDHIRK